MSNRKFGSVEFFVRGAAVLGLWMLIPCGSSAQTVSSPLPIASGGFGAWVAGSPDLTGDGRGDIIVGAHDETAGGIAAAGRVHVFSGRTRNIFYSLQSPTPQADGSFGFSAASVPDITGDGKPEVIVGAYKESGPGSPTRAGRAYLFNGANGLPLRTLMSPHEQDTGSFGISVAGIQDVNGDHRGDVIVGAVDEDPVGGPTDAGRAYIMDGFTGDVIWELQSPYPDPMGWFGLKVDGVPDADGDGAGDVIIGAYQEYAFGLQYAGSAYLFSGKTGQLIWLLLSPRSVFDGRFGVSVAGSPDLTGDGRGDVLIGACCEVPLGFNDRAGNVYAYSGATGELVAYYSSPQPQAHAQFGFSVAAVPDITGDGLAEVVIGAIRENALGSPGGSGRAYIFTGLEFATPLHQLFSPNAESLGNFGVSVGALPDAGGDFLGDVIVGAYHENPGAAPEDSGKAYLFDGYTGSLALHRNEVKNWMLYD